MPGVTQLVHGWSLSPLGANKAVGSHLPEYKRVSDRLLEKAKTHTLVPWDELSLEGIGGWVTYGPGYLSAGLVASLALHAGHAGAQGSERAPLQEWIMLVEDCEDNTKKT